MDSPSPHVAILGAGPIGLEAALAAADAGLPFTVYEAGPRPGHHVRRWGHVRLFSPWRLNASPRARARLEREGWEAPPDGEHPTGDELAGRFLDPLAGLPEIAPRLELGTRVVSVGRQGLLKHEEIATAERARRPFRLLVEGADGREAVRTADAVLDCTGTYGQPNATGDGGVPAPGERALDGRIARRLPDLLDDDREAWSGRTVLLVGGGHSAQTAARDLARLAREEPETRTVWALRGEDPSFGRIPDDPLPERDRLAAEAGELARGGADGLEPRPGRVVERFGGDGGAGSPRSAAGRHATDAPTEANAGRRGTRETAGPLSVTLRRSDGGTETVEVDRVLSLTGYVGDRSLHRQLQFHACYATEAPMKLAAALLEQDTADCLEREAPDAGTLRSPEPGFFVLGVKSYGRDSTFLLRNGWEQVERAVSMIREDVRETARETAG
jgi:cation diffusion facilitator CzcD-associated flavoprotein CzcO